MKSILFFVTIILFASGGLSQIGPTSEIKLSPTFYENNTFILDLRQLGAEYTLEMGIFTQKPPLPNGHWVINKFESVYRSSANGITYYRFIVQLLCQSNPNLIRATYTVSYRSSNGDTKITQSSYSLVTKPDRPAVVGGSTFINNALLVTGSDLQDFFDVGLKFTVDDAMKKGLIKKSTTYSFLRLFSIQDLGIFSIAPGYNFLIQIASAEGNYYRARITVYDNSNLEPDLQPVYTIYRSG